MGWKMIGCAVEGRRHTAMHIPCQDQYRLLSAGDLQIAALADGAGSASHSHFGARCAVDAVCALLAASFDELYAMQNALEAQKTIVSAVLDTLQGAAQEHGVGLRELACTLLFTAIRGERMLIGHIGDGVICYQRGDALKVASRPTNGEFANSTVFVTSPDAVASMRLIRGTTAGITGFCLMTDGTAASLYDRRTHTPMPVLGRLMRFRAAMAAEPLQQMLEDSFYQSIRLHTQDDCSIVLMANGSAQALTGDDLAVLLPLPQPIAQRARQLARYRQLLTLAAKPVSLNKIARSLHVKPRCARRYANALLEAQLLGRTGGKWIAGAAD